MPKIILSFAYGRANLEKIAAETEEIVAVLHKPFMPSSLYDAIMTASGRKTARKKRADPRQDSVHMVASRLRGSKILLAEDNEINQDIARELLASKNISVRIAATGLEAIELLQQESFDGVLMDCQMPVMDGYAATRKIRQMQRFKDLPIIAMTANVMAGDREKSLAAGMNDHIGKPINMQQLMLTLGRWLRPSCPIPQEPSGFGDEEPGGAALPDLPGINVRAGLATVQGNTHLYRRLLAKFIKAYAAFDALFLAAQQEDDPSAAERCAHTLKSVAGNIGAQHVQQAAKDLEQACKDNASEESVNTRLKRVLEALAPVLAGGGLLGGGCPRVRRRRRKCS